MFYRNKNIATIFNTLRLNLRLGRALQIASGFPDCFIHRSCYSLQIGRLQVLNRGLHLDFEVLHAVVEIWWTQNETKSNPRLNVCTSRADSYSSSQAAAAREIQGRA